MSRRSLAHATRTVVTMTNSHNHTEHQVAVYTPQRQAQRRRPWEARLTDKGQTKTIATLSCRKSRALRAWRKLGVRGSFLERA